MLGKAPHRPPAGAWPHPILAEQKPPCPALAAPGPSWPPALPGSPASAASSSRTPSSPVSLLRAAPSPFPCPAPHPIPTEEAAYGVQGVHSGCHSSLTRTPLQILKPDAGHHVLRAPDPAAAWCTSPGGPAMPKPAFSLKSET